MSDCSQFEDLLGRLFADELDREHEERLDSHLETCADCRQLAALHRRLMRADLELEAPDKAEITAMRWSVLTQLRRAPRPHRAHRARSIFAAIAAALFLLGIALGRALPRDDMARLLEHLDPESISADDAWMLSSVDLSPRDDGQVELRFELSRPVAITRATGDPLVAMAMEESLLGAPNLGARIRAVSMAGRLAANPAIRQTLLVAAEYDSSIAVRLQALNLLSPYLDEPDVQAVLAKIVEIDDAVPVRLLALELLGDTTTYRPPTLDESARIGL